MNNLDKLGSSPLSGLTRKSPLDGLTKGASALDGLCKKASPLDGLTKIAANPIIQAARELAAESGIRNIMNSAGDLMPTSKAYTANLFEELFHKGNRGFADYLELFGRNNAYGDSEIRRGVAAAYNKIHGTTFTPDELFRPTNDLGGGWKFRHMAGDTPTEYGMSGGQWSNLSEQAAAAQKAKTDEIMRNFNGGGANGAVDDVAAETAATQRARGQGNGGFWNPQWTPYAVGGAGGLMAANMFGGRRGGY